VEIDPAQGNTTTVFNTAGHLHAVLPVSISQAEQVHLACSLREKLRSVHQRVATSRCGELARPPAHNSRRSPTTEEVTYERGEATDRPYSLSERSKVLECPSSPLRLRAACVPHALYTTDEFDAPSDRKDTLPKNTRVKPLQGAPTSHLANIGPAHLDACVGR
jgi:hypothetical protein